MGQHGRLPHEGGLKAEDLPQASNVQNKVAPVLNLYVLMAEQRVCYPVVDYNYGRTQSGPSSIPNSVKIGLDMLAKSDLPPLPSAVYCHYRQVGSCGPHPSFHLHVDSQRVNPFVRSLRSQTPESVLDETPHIKTLISCCLEISEDKEKYLGSSKGRLNKYEDGGNSPRTDEMDSSLTGRTLKEVPNWLNDINGRLTEGNEGNATSDSDDLKSDVQSIRKSVRRRRKRNKSPRAVTRKEDFHSGQRRPFSVTGRITENESQSKDKWHKKHESCALEEKYIREFIQREINKQQNGFQGPAGRAFPDKDGMMNEVKGNFKRIDEDEIDGYGSNHPEAFQYKPKKYEGRVSRRSDAFHRREKSNGFFSFLKWFKKSKEMPELEGLKDSSVTSSPLFIRRRSSSCGSVDTLFSIATANSFAFVSPVQYQAVISSSHTTYPVPPATKTDDESKGKNQSDYENNPSPAKSSEEVKVEGQATGEKKKKNRAPDPPVVRDISLPSTLEHKKTEEDDPEGKGGHRRTVSESFKDKKAGFYCHVQGKRKAPLPPPTAPLYPSLSSLKSQCPSISKKKRPAPPPPDGKDVKPKEKSADTPKSASDNRTTTPNYDNLPFLNPKSNEESSQKEGSKPNSSNLSPLLGLANDLSSSPLPSRPWYKRSSSGSNIVKKESGKFGDRKKNKENEDWMPEVGFSRRPISNEGSHNLFNLLSRLDRNQEKKKEEKRKSQISILANISELDREAAEIVRKEHAQEKKLMADKDEKYYSSHYDKNVLSMFPNIQNGTAGQAEKAAVSGGLEKPTDSPKKATRSPFDEFKQKNDSDDINKSTISNGLPEKPKELEKKEKAEDNAAEYDANAELDYYINPWNCPRCTLKNPGWEKFCEACNMRRTKFRPTAEAATKEVEKPQNAEVKPAEERPKLTKSKSEDVTSSRGKEEPEDPSEDNLEAVRRKRLAFFTSRQSSLRESTAVSSSDEDDKLKLKMMLKEMKNSLPKREKGVINTAAPETSAKDGASGVSSVEKEPNLESRERASGAADSKPSPKEFSNTKVQQTWQPIANEPNKYGAVKKVKQHEPGPSSTTAEAIIVTKTTVLEDIIVKRNDKGHKVSTSVQTSSSVKDQHHGKPEEVTKKEAGDAASGQAARVVENHAYANVQNIKEKQGVLDLSAPENTFTNGDIEAITAKLQREGAGSADYQVDIQATSSKAGTNTFDVNQLLRKLEAAINTGRHLEAANIAKELARMKVSCSVKRQKLVPDAGQSKIIVDLYVEDKVTHKGPIQIKIIPSITLGQLKMKIEREWDIPRNVQRWILGKHLATDDAKTLEQHGVVNNSCPLFLYLVTPEQTGDANENSEPSKNEPEPGKNDRINGKFPVMYGEARRPSLIIEESGESGCEGESDNAKIADDGESGDVREVKQKSPENARISTPGAKRREAFQRRDSQSSFSFEKRDINENLKKELKVISANSVKDRIEQLNRAATGRGNEAKTKGESRTEANKQKWHYNELMQLENADLVANTEEFECPICLVGYEPGEGVVLKDCLHTFCRPCLVNTIQFNEEAEVKCPYRDEKYSCESVLQQREIKSLVPKGIFEQHLAKSVSVAENNIGNAYHCKTPDCKGWCILEDNVNEFRCPVCRLTNCLTCQSIHTGMNCRQYQEQIQFASDTNVEAKKTRDMLQEMVAKGEAMACPTCQVVLMKKWGCDWLRCSMCKTEICWVTRGPRWGPGGKGDTSGGCQCGVNGIKCHPKCNYCH